MPPLPQCYVGFVMSLPAVSLGDWFSVSRNGGTGEGWVGIYYIHPKGENNMAVSGFGCKIPLAGSFLIL